MRTLEIPVKFSKDDKIYTITQNRKEVVCPICNGEKTITIKENEFTCPECHGEGKTLSNKFKHIVLTEPFVITSTKVHIDDEDNKIIRYKGRCGNIILDRVEHNLFSTKKEAQKRCDYLNMERKDVLVKDIIITGEFAVSNPSVIKVYEKMDYYRNNGRFEGDIILNSNGILLDGYINYLICKTLKVDIVRVLIDERDSKTTFGQFIDKVDKEFYNSIKVRESV